MDTIKRRRGHLNRWALSALIEAAALDVRAEDGRLIQTGRTKQDIAIAAQLSPQALNDLLSGRRHGRHPETRAALADALSVDGRALECLCTSPDDHEETFDE
jgi:hypothetical protein